MLRARVVTALALLFGLLGVLFLLPPAATAAAFGLVAALAAWEWAGLMGIGASGRIFFGILVAAFCWQTYVAGTSAFLLFWFAAAGFWLVAAAPWLRFRWRLAGNDFGGYLLGVVLIVATWAAMVYLQQRGPWVLLGAMAIAWISDIAAYFTGRAWGRRKLAPNISPGKTWEGVAGGMAGVAFYGLVIGMASGYLAAVSAFGAIGASAVLMGLAALGIMGDLFESLLKRQAGIKDSSGLLPGHGGVLDRIDSLLAILPLSALLLYWRAA